MNKDEGLSRAEDFNQNQEHYEQLEREKAQLAEQLTEARTVIRELQKRNAEAASVWLDETAALRTQIEALTPKCEYPSLCDDFLKIYDDEMPALQKANQRRQTHPIREIREAVGCVPRERSERRQAEGEQE